MRSAWGLRSASALLEITKMSFLQFPKFVKKSVDKFLKVWHIMQAPHESDVNAHKQLNTHNYFNFADSHQSQPASQC